MARFVTATLVLVLAASVACLEACGSGTAATTSGADGGGEGDGGAGGSSCPTPWSTLVPFGPIAGDDVARDMHVDGDALYYSSLGGILSVPLAGGNPATVVSVPNPASIQAFTVLSGGIDYVRDGALFRVAKTGGTPTKLAVLADYAIAGLERNGEVWTDDKTVVWATTTYDSAGKATMGIRAMTLASQATVDLVQGAQDTLSTVTVVGGVVYYDEGAVAGAPGPSKVQSVPLAGGTPTTLEPDGVLVAVDATALYYGSAAGAAFAGSAMRAAIAGGAGSAFAPGFEADVGNAVFVDTRAFFAGVQGGDPVVLQAPRSGGSAQTVFCAGGNDSYSLDVFDVSGNTLYAALTRNSDMSVGIVDVALP